MQPRSPIGIWTMLKLAAAALAVWGVTLMIFVDIDKLVWRW